MLTYPFRTDPRDLLAGDRILLRDLPAGTFSTDEMQEITEVKPTSDGFGVTIFVEDDPEPHVYLATAYHDAEKGTDYWFAGPVWAQFSHPRSAPAVIDADWLNHKAEFSKETFGPGQRTLGVVDHIRKELDEILEDPTDLNEWVDVIILGLDGASRAGWESQEIIDAIIAKQARNEARTWPDWRTMSEDQAIEHDRSVPETV